jgi:capsular exopolysaccharide synthesis family protein
LSKYYELLQRVSVESETREAKAAAPRPHSRVYEMRPVPDANSLSREELVKLIQTVFLLPGNQSPKVVVFSGAESGAGCSSICTGAAEALAAHVSEPVCLVDSNLRFPSLHLCLGVENDKGLREALVSPEPVREFVRKLPGDRLWLLTSGLTPPSRMGTMNSSHLAAKIEELRREFPYILIDSPPVNIYSDAISLGQSADGVVLVISANTTRKDAARRAKMSFEGAGARLLGAVLNNRTYPIPQSIYDRL